MFRFWTRGRNISMVPDLIKFMFFILCCQLGMTHQDACLVSRTCCKDMSCLVSDSTSGSTCYCDRNCSQNGNCCSDYHQTCSNSSINSTFTSCKDIGYCCSGIDNACYAFGRRNDDNFMRETCFCDESCLTSGDCCADYDLFCRSGVISNTSPSSCSELGYCCNNTNRSCHAVVSNLTITDICYCDESCIGYHDCCSDYNATCSPTLIVNGSCSNLCCTGSNSSCFSTGTDGKKCYCDQHCLKGGDCCSDFSTVCQDLMPAGSCSNACCFGSNSSCHVIGLNGKKCYCDENCLKSGDCCADFANHCYSYLTGTCSDRTNNQQCCSRTDNKCYVYGQRNYTTTKTKCFCDEACVHKNDCCLDGESVCAFPPGTGSCADIGVCCSGNNASCFSVKPDGKKCYCDDQCQGEKYPDCCDDYATFCNTSGKLFMYF